MISRQSVYEAIEDEEVLGDYPNDPRGHGCLALVEIVRKKRCMSYVLPRMNTSHNNSLHPKLIRMGKESEDEEEGVNALEMLLLWGNNDPQKVALQY